MTQEELLTAGLLATVLAVAFLHRPLGWLLKLAGRSAVGVAVLAVLNQVGSGLGLGLGVNWFNALVLGVFGTPGLGLLLLAKWWVSC
ncbi:MAG: pro-sigmaK processing inhibitor BofA family protein [Clostridiales bacterium]|nr:pro-sigmaK processing inhibitor BofA family protein [Clostridiales bacterium]MCD8367977.1 pro-sigmaK processing inhibitor BofA family protein [Clostridiales bacterium]